RGGRPLQGEAVACVPLRGHPGVDRRTNAPWIGGKPSVLIFDVNETLLDLESMNPLFKRVFGDECVLREWLGHLVMYSMTLTLSGLSKDFFSLGQPVPELRQ